MCFANGCKRNSDSAHAKKNGKQRVGELAFWSPFTLEFMSDIEERRFQKAIGPTWHLQDFVGYWFSLVSGPAFAHSFRDVLPLWAVLPVAFFCCIVAPLNIYNYIFREKDFARYRTVAVVFARLFVSMNVTSYVFFMRAPDPSLPGIFATMITKSAAFGMFFLPLVHRLPFKRHAILQTVAFMQFLGWIPVFCRKCAMRSEILQKFNEVGNWMEWVLARGLLRGTPQRTVTPCWMMSILVIAVLAYIIPMFCVFVTEVWSRTLFLKTRLSQQYHSCLNEYALQAVKFATVALMSAITALWFLFSHAQLHTDA